jgi:2-keto-4-pentenoate hydratase/2-oxohepta-3-ene-1,7-dioic acid hydratase in catechol pathway
MWLYRTGESEFAVRDDHGLRRLHSPPFETDPESWRTGEPVDAETLAPLAPVIPGKIVCIGRSYRDHAAELGNPMPSEPLIFLKPPSSVLDPGGTILLPPESERVDYEGEIAVVLGRRLRRGAGEEQARAAIFGVTCACDVTARDLQRADRTFTRGKGFDTFCPLGPAIRVDPDLDALALETRLNGQPRQSAPLSDLHWGVAELLVYVAGIMTLEPGDVLLTGTPAGVGPLAAGDRLEVEVNQVGVLANRVAQGRSA